MTTLAWYYILHKAGLISIYKLHHFSFKALFLNKCKKSFDEYAEHFVRQSYKDLINQQIVDLLKKKQASDHHIVILSSSPDFLVTHFANKLGVKLFDATRYQTSSGNFSKVGQVLEGDEKAVIVKEIAEKLSVSIENTFAYSDSHLDISFLESVGNPFAVNPSNSLRKHSIQNSWEIIQTIP